MNRQTSPALQHKVSNRISDPSLPPRSESFSSGGIQQARTPPMHRSVEPQVCVLRLHVDCVCVCVCVYIPQGVISLSLTESRKDLEAAMPRWKTPCL